MTLLVQLNRCERKMTDVCFEATVGLTVGSISSSVSVPLSTHPGRCVAGSDWQKSAHPNKQQLHVSCGFLLGQWGNSKSDPPKKWSPTTKNVAGLPPSTVVFDTNIHKVKVFGTSKSFLHLVASLSQDDWILKPESNDSTAFSRVFCVANCSSYSCWYISGKLWNLTKHMMR